MLGASLAVLAIDAAAARATPVPARAAAVPARAAVVPPTSAERARAERLRERARAIGGAPAAPDAGGLSLPGGLRVVALVLGGLLLVALVAGTVLVVRRRSPTATTGGRRAGAPADSPTADGLDRDAEAAVARGDHDAAVRLRYRAAVRRLRDRDALPARPVTPRDVADAVAAPGEAGPLVATVERVAYRGDAADARDSDAARRWRAVVDADADARPADGEGDRKPG